MWHHPLLCAFKWHLRVRTIKTEAKTQLSLLLQYCLHNIQNWQHHILILSFQLLKFSYLSSTSEFSFCIHSDGCFEGNAHASGTQVSTGQVNNHTCYFLVPVSAHSHQRSHWCLTTKEKYWSSVQKRMPTENPTVCPHGQHWSRQANSLTCP